MTPPHSTSRIRAFTLLEMLLVIAVLFLLVTVIFVAMRAIRTAANRTETSNSLRQMIGGYNAYANEYGGRLMPGYIDPAEIGTNAGDVNIKAKLASGEFIANEADVAGYVWRLAPYLSHEWHVYMSDYRSGGLNTKFSDQFQAAVKVLGPGSAPTGVNELSIGFNPAFGLNSIFLGGDSFHGGVGNLAPWNVAGAVEPKAITRISQASNAARLIVFGPSRLRNPSAQLSNQADGLGIKAGAVELRAPFLDYNHATGAWTVPQWAIDPATNEAIAAGGTFTNTGGGVPIARWDKELIPVAHLDGSVDQSNLVRLANDPTRWVPNALGSTGQ